MAENRNRQREWLRLTDGKTIAEHPGFFNFAVDKNGLLMEAARVSERFADE